jgi:hypothetical protein
MNRLLSLLLCFTAIASTINPASATIINVPGGQSTIQAGINAASPGDTVLVKPGRYIENIDFKGKDIVVGSMFMATRDSSYISQTIIDGNKNGSVVTFKNGETEKAKLCGVTVIGGDTLYDPNQLPFLIVLSFGGGIYCKNVSPYLSHLIVERNSTDFDGGGIHLEKSNSVIEYCVIRNNRASGIGGGIYIKSGINDIIHCVIDNNSFGGLAVGYSIVRCYSTLITKNSFLGLISSISNLDIINCTVTKHINDTFRIQDSNVNIINSIFWNDYPGISEITISDNYPIQPISHIKIAYSDIKGGKDNIIYLNDSISYEDNNIEANPNLNSDYTLNRNSPCIDAGTDFYQISDSTLVDLNKNEYKGNAPDIGAFESNYPLTVNNNKDYKDNFKLSNFPNPFNSKTIIKFSLNEEYKVNLSIYDITGQKVIDLLDKSLPIGNHQIQWNGIDNSGNKISSGVYIIRLNSGIRSISERIVYMK